MFRRSALAAILVLLVSSASLFLISLAPGDHLAGFELSPEAAAAERVRLKLDRPFIVQYVAWLGRAARLDLGQSLKYGLPVTTLIGQRAQNTALLGVAALLVATLLGIPAGIVTGSQRGPLAAVARGVSMVLISLPPLVTSFTLLLLAARTGWFPVGGFASGSAGILDTIRYLFLPCLALAIPLAATLERIQSQALRDALDEPSIRAATARGCSPTRIVWRHALRLSLPTVLAVYGVIVGSVLSGSFAVEIVMAWPGLGALMYEALVSRDLSLVAGCAAAGAAFLVAGVLGSDLALAFADPRIGRSPGIDQ
jgi:ABC-type dipeptide/oligopeptide/nickel transport system permease component